MKVLTQSDFCVPATDLRKGYTAIGAIGSAGKEEAAMRILFFSKRQGEYVAVSWDDLVLQWNDPLDESSLIKAVGGLSRLAHSLQKLLELGFLDLQEEHYYPTPKLVECISKAVVYE